MSSICLFVIPWKSGRFSCSYLFLFGTKFGIFAWPIAIMNYYEGMKDQDRAFFENVVFSCLVLLSIAFVGILITKFITYLLN